MPWADLNKRQQEYLQAVYETDQEQESYERGQWKRGGKPRLAHEWRWMEYGVFDGVGSTLYMKLYLRKLIDEGTGSTFNALEARRYIKCKYTHKRRDSDRETLERFLMVQITKEGRKLVREATGQKRASLPVGTLREWHWKALALAWAAGEEGVDYLVTSWNTWLRLRDYTQAGQPYPLIKEVLLPLSAKMQPTGFLSISTPQYVIVLTEEGKHYYRENWQRYRGLYPQVNAPEPDKKAERGGEKLPVQPSATKHICDRCRHKHLEIEMEQVSLYDGEYTMWTAGRATYFRSHHLKYPTLVWLCGNCYSEASRTQAEEARTGEPSPLPPARSTAEHHPQARKARRATPHRTRMGPNDQ